MAKYRDVILPDGTEVNAKVLQTLMSTPQADQKEESKPIESPTPIPLPRMSSLLSSSKSQRSLPPIPPEKLPSVATSTTAKKASKRPVNLHLEIPHTNTVLSPSIYLASLPRTPLPSPSLESRPILFSNSTSQTSTTVIRPTPLTASTYPTAASRPPSILGAGSPPASPSIANLSQLSMVRQRLAQIERNHSQISSRSGYSDAVVARPSTPVTPVTPVAWRSKMRETTGPGFSAGSFPLETRGEGSELPDKPEVTPIKTPKVMSRVHSADTERIPTPPSLKGRGKESIAIPQSPINDTKQHQVKRDEKECLSKPRLTKDVEDLSKRIAEVKGALGGESGYPTIHQIVLGLEDRTEDNKKLLKTIQERIDEIGSCLKDVQSSTAALSSTGNETTEGIKNDETQESVLRAIGDLEAKLIAEFPSLRDKVQELQSAQAILSEKLLENEKSNIPPTTAENVVDLKPVLDKLDELSLLLQSSQKTPEGPEEGSQILDVSAKYITSSRGNMRLILCPVKKNVEKVLSIVQQESSKQVLFSQQQADSVRYLNELNNVRSFDRVCVLCRD